MEKKLAAAWVLVLAIIASLVIMNVNFGFQDKFLREELVDHTAIRAGTKSACACPSCGLTGLAYCAHCGKPMNWDATVGKFVCLPCREIGNPACPKCNTPMVGASSVRVQSVDPGTGQPVPVF